MFDSIFLDIGVGVAVVFFIAASVISAFNEWVTRLLDIRAKVLWKALSNALDDNETNPFVISFWHAASWFRWSDNRPVVTDDIGSVQLTSLLANTNLINALGGETRYFNRKRTKVDAIAGTTFSSALVAAAHRISNRDVLDVLAETRQAHRVAADLIAGSPGVRVRDVVAGWTEAQHPGTLTSALRQVTPRGGNAAELASLADPICESAAAWSAAANLVGKPEGQAWLEHAIGLHGLLPETIDQVELELGVDIVHELSRLTANTAVGEVIDAASYGEAATLASVTDAITDWFDAHMERVSELYKLAARKVLFVVGVLLAVGLNLSAIDLVADLRDNSNARSAISAGVDATCQGATVAECHDELLAVIEADTGRISLPGLGEWTNPYSALRDGGTKADPDPWWEMVIGWLITGFAISFGAPFWFDVVQKLSSYRRSAG